MNQFIEFKSNENMVYMMLGLNHDAVPKLVILDYGIDNIADTESHRDKSERLSPVNLF
jgi:hypothetical protein